MCEKSVYSVKFEFLIINKMLKNSAIFQNNNDWNNFVKSELSKEYFKKLIDFLSREYNEKTIFPSLESVFSALENTSFSSVKVVVIGQDPYHSFEVFNDEIIPHAHGLSFSVPKKAKKIPPSLKNIFKEINNDLGFPIPENGNLTSWAQQGVLLINATLTVEKHLAGSHQKKGWEDFTGHLIKYISKNNNGVVFLLWGKFAQNKAELIDSTKHFILKAPHPSPFSARKGFFGCKHFSKTNQILKNQGLKEIDWQIK